MFNFWKREPEIKDEEWIDCTEDFYIGGATLTASVKDEPEPCTAGHKGNKYCLVKHSCKMGYYFTVQKKKEPTCKEV